MAWKFRGSGIRHTLPYIGRFVGLWVVVTLVAVGVAAVSSYLLFAARDPRGMPMAGALILQTLLVLAAVIGLGVFTTHRLAGPWIAIRRALESVRAGNLDTVLKIRSADTYLRDVERSFNDMMASLRARDNDSRRSA